MSFSVHFIPGVVYRVSREATRTAGSAGTNTGTFTAQDLPKALPEIGVTESVAHWIDGGVDIAQPIT